MHEESLIRARDRQAMKTDGPTINRGCRCRTLLCPAKFPSISGSAFGTDYIGVVTGRRTAMVLQFLSMSHSAPAARPSIFTPS